ncbi:MAG: MgtC/SapB family protein [bacterium]
MDFIELMDFSVYLKTILLPVVVTFLASWLIGFERQNVGKAAGISPHVLIACTACCLALMQKEFNTEFDAQRIIAQLVTGVGFLGAGVIMKSKYSVKGLTTATTLFASAIIGLIIGSGFYEIGLTLTAVVLLFMYGRNVLRGINPFTKIKVKENETHLDE